MRIEELIGKSITNIYQFIEIEQGWLDKADCYIELDKELIIGIPFGYSEDVWIRQLDDKAKSIFADLSDIPIYHVNKEGKSIGEIAASYQKKKRNIFNRIRKALFNYEVVNNAYKPYKIEYRENKIKYLVDRKITDFIWYEEEIEYGYLLLDNGYLITETGMSPSGTGQAGINYYESIDTLIKSKGENFIRITGKIK